MGASEILESPQNDWYVLLGLSIVLSPFSHIFHFHGNPLQHLHVPWLTAHFFFFFFFFADPSVGKAHFEA